MPDRSADQDTTPQTLLDLRRTVLGRRREHAAWAMLLVFMVAGFAACLAVIWAVSAPLPEVADAASPPTPPAARVQGDPADADRDSGGDAPGGERSAEPDPLDQGPVVPDPRSAPPTAEPDAAAAEPAEATPRAGSGGEDEAPPLGFASSVSQPPRNQTEPAPSPALGGQSGVGGGRDEAGDRGAGGDDAGATFFGQRGRGMRFVYIIDKSGSMSGLRFESARDELIRSIQAMGRRASFFVIFFDREADPMPAAGLVPASAAAKRHYLDWVRGVSVGGGTDPSEAVLFALEKLSPDTIWLLSDGQFNPEITDAIRRANRLRNVQINTIAFHDRSGEPLLKKIASENHGDYRFVPAP